MSPRTPEDAGHRLGRRLEPLGRATRVELQTEPSETRAVLFRLGREDREVAERLAELGATGLGGFVERGEDGEGPWLVRRVPGTTLADRFRADKVPWRWREALELAVAVGRALAAAEDASLFVGPVTPDAVALDDAGPTVVAERLVRALAGAAAGEAAATSAPAALWTPPAQADGAPWDSAANRYVLGLMLYRMLGGTHPFSGAGLRHALGQAAQSEAPPFEDSVAGELPSGLQSFVLRMLDPDPRRRPAHARAIVETLESFAEGRERGRASSTDRTLPSGEAPREPRADRPAPAPEPTSPRRKPSKRETTPRAPAAAPVAKLGSVPVADVSTARTRALQRWLPLAAGLAVALGALLLLESPDRPRKPRSPDTEIAPLGAGQTLGSDCAKCHPRQAAEWRRSVMAHSVKSPLFNALESLIEEQVGRDFDCPNGAGLLRRTDDRAACRDRGTGLPVSGAGGEHWCVNCHSPADNLSSTMPVWEGRAGGSPESRYPVRDLLSASALEGISCGFCHQVHGPVGPRGSGGYEGNPTWRSFVTGATFSYRPEDARGVFGIANSGYDLRPEELLVRRVVDDEDDPSPPGVHARPSRAAKSYLASSEFCGACHDVRLVGTDVIGAAQGDHFKRLRNAYTEWLDYGRTVRSRGDEPASCQDCHMSTFPGVCEPDPDGDGDHGCPKGTSFSRRRPGALSEGRIALNSPRLDEVSTHYFSGVDLPLSSEYPDEILDEASLDLHGMPLSAKKRRDMLLRAAMRLELAPGEVRGGRLEIPVVIENVGAGHKVPAGFSQEREIWVHLTVTDASGRVVYEVGSVDRADEDLHDKVFLRVNTNPDRLDRQGRPEGLFGADVRDGPDVPRWSPSPALGGQTFRGSGLVNFQNGFLRCVRCIGQIGPGGSCEPGPGQGLHRADRYEDGDYDLDTGECRSNLFGDRALFETYFPVGSLDASRGGIKAPDAIIDTRSLSFERPVTYTYEVPLRGANPPFEVKARLMFRAFPPFLLKAFADYELEQTRKGLRPSGPLLTHDALRRLELVEIASDEQVVR